MNWIKIVIKNMMSSVRKILMVFIFLLPISHSFAAMVTFVQKAAVDDSSDVSDISGIHFNVDGTKMFTMYSTKDGGVSYRQVSEYNLTTAFDVSTKSYAGDSERCVLNHGGTFTSSYDLEFSSDGMKLFFVEGPNSSGNDADKVFQFDLTSPYDVSTCTYANNATSNLEGDNDLQNGSNAGNRTSKSKNRLQGFEINDDGTKIFLLYHGAGSEKPRLLEYQLSTPYDLTTISLVTTAGIALDGQGVSNPMGMRFSPNGKRLWITSHTEDFEAVTQISLSLAYDTSSFTIDGSFSLTSTTLQPRGIGFSANGLKMYVGSDDDSVADEVHEFNLVCPFNIIASKCPPITENKDRTGIAMAQIEIAKRTIDHSTDTALNRLKWIRRNKDKQNLTNLNINFKFTDQRLASLTEAVKTSAAKKKDKEEDVFYWSEGSIAIGRIGDTSISSTKKIDTDAITFGADKFTDENGIKGLAFRVGRNSIDVGNEGSNVDTDTVNITFYSTSPVEDDTKSLDSIIGFGKLNSDLLTILDGERTTAERDGHQMYGTIRIKDEIKKDNLTLIPSGRFDIGYSYLESYKESGLGAIDVKGQSIISKKIRAGLAAVDDLPNDKYDIKRHGKIEYVADIDRSTLFKYTYFGDSNVKFNDTLHTGALHNINGEIGIDIVLPDSFSIFLIYERNQALGSGHTDKLHIALGYLPNKETNFAFSIDGIDNFKSNYVLSKNINDYNIDLKLTNDLMRPKEYDEVLFNLRRKF